ncbi:N-acetylmuramoyl-L-alanine amidase [Tetragenococcus solitarius]|nr:N-acetylmuramoyl-L-alanine amidase [Tetragenococcus solitarius]
MALPKTEKQIRKGTPQVGNPPFKQIHAHSTGNPDSTAQNEADFMQTKDLTTGFYTHVVGNGRVIQVAPVNQGCWDVGGDWNSDGYASIELIESHKTRAEFEKDYKNYIDLLRKAAKNAGVAIKVDSGETGILSHNYCSLNQPNSKSDHVDPYPYLAKWGISQAQFKKDVESGQVGNGNNQPRQIAVDGQWGSDCTKRLQEYFGTKPIDGVISGQIKTRANENVYAAEWGTGGSNVVRAIQKQLGLAQDGNIGPGTVKAMQKHYGTTQDGIISPISDMVKEMQKALNNDQF